MKKREILFMLYALFYIILIAVPAVAAMQNEPDGFRDIRWRTKLTEDGADGVNNKCGLTEDTDIAEPSVRVYSRKNESLTFGSAEIFSVHYFFQKSLGFSKVQISAEGQRNFELIRNESINKWGEPDGEDRVRARSSDNINIYWYGKKVIALLVYDKGQNDITLYIYLNNYHQTVRTDDDAIREEQENS